MMLQHLLAERFKLAVHHESREMQTFRLVGAPGGPKLTAHAEDASADVERGPTSVIARTASLSGARERR